MGVGPARGVGAGVGGRGGGSGDGIMQQLLVFGVVAGIPCSSPLPELSPFALGVVTAWPLSVREGCVGSGVHGLTGSYADDTRVLLPFASPLAGIRLFGQCEEWGRN